MHIIDSFYYFAILLCICSNLVIAKHRSQANNRGSDESDSRATNRRSAESASRGTSDEGSTDTDKSTSTSRDSSESGGHDNKRAISGRRNGKYESDSSSDSREYRKGHSHHKKTTTQAPSWMAQTAPHAWNQQPAPSWPQQAPSWQQAPAAWQQPAAPSWTVQRAPAWPQPAPAWSTPAPTWQHQAPAWNVAPSQAAAQPAPAWPQSAPNWPRPAPAWNAQPSATWPTAAPTWPTAAPTWPTAAPTWPTAAPTWPTAPPTWPTTTAPHIWSTPATTSASSHAVTQTPPISSGIAADECKNTASEAERQNCLQLQKFSRISSRSAGAQEQNAPAVPEPAAENGAVNSNTEAASAPQQSAVVQSETASQSAPSAVVAPADPAAHSVMTAPDSAAPAASFAVVSPEVQAPAAAVQSSLDPAAQPVASGFLIVPDGTVQAAPAGVENAAGLAVPSNEGIADVVAESKKSEGAEMTFS